MRQVIKRIVITTGEKRGDVRITLHGDLDTILDWSSRGATMKTKLERSQPRLFRFGAIMDRI